MVTWICSEEQGLWRDYRLGDMVTLKVSREKPDGEKLHAKLFPTSIASQYMSRTTGQDKFTILADIVRNWKSCSDRIDWAVHIRGGDVLEEKMSINPLQHATINAESGHSCDVSQENLLKSNTWYVRSIDDIMADFNPKSIDKELTVCIITGGCHVVEAPRTKTYVNTIAHKFSKHPKVKHVIIRFFHSPDEDFVIMCRAPRFIPSGGQYTYIIQNTRNQPKVVQKYQREH